MGFFLKNRFKRLPGISPPAETEKAVSPCRFSARRRRSGSAADADRANPALLSVDIFQIYYFL